MPGFEKVPLRPELSAVERQFTRSRSAEEPGWLRYVTEAEMADETAHCQVAL